MTIAINKSGEAAAEDLLIRRGTVILSPENYALLEKDSWLAERVTPAGWQVQFALEGVGPKLLSPLRGATASTIRDARVNLREALERAHAMPLKIAKEVGIPELRIISCVAAMPYLLDAELDVARPAEIERLAYAFFQKDNYSIRYRHQHKLAAARMVETFVFPYPTPDDRRKAFLNQDHTAYLYPFGDQKVPSGTWVTSLQLPPAEFAQYKTGTLRGLSIGGMGERIPLDTTSIPDVTFIDLAANARGGT